MVPACQHDLEAFPKHLFKLQSGDDTDTEAASRPSAAERPRRFEPVENRTTDYLAVVESHKDLAFAPMADSCEMRRHEHETLWP